MSCSQPELLFQEFFNWKKLFVKHFFLSIWEIKNGEDWLKSTLAEEEVEEHLGDSMKDDEGEFWDEMESESGLSVKFSLLALCMT